MGLQARMSENDRRLYSPNRDVAHNFKDVMELVASRLEDGKWPELAELLQREGVTMDDLGEACASYCQYIASANTEPTKSMVDSLKDSGFFKTKPAAQVAVLAMIGVCYAGIQYAGVREATVNGEGPLKSVPELMQYAVELRKYMGMSWFQRARAKINARFSRVFAALKD